MLADGYYLSVYSDIQPILNLMQESIRHDHSMSLFEKTGDTIKLIHYWEFERYTGFKHHRIAFYCIDDAQKFINGLLSQYGLSLNDMAGVFGTPALATTDISEGLDDLISFHAISHLFSSALTDTEKIRTGSSIALAIDVGPDSMFKIAKKHYCAGVFIDGKLIDLFPCLSPGLYWRFAYRKYNLLEGTLMALAYATPCKTLEAYEDFIDIYDEKSERASFALFDKLYNCIQNYTKEDIGVKHTGFEERFTDEENKISIMMKIIQEQSIKKVCNTIDLIIDKYKLCPEDTHISISGGYALNCPTNTYLMRKYKFKGQIFCPCVNDGGQSLGMGLYFFYKHMGLFEFSLDSAFYGGHYDENAALQKFKYYIESIENNMDNIALDIANEPIVYFSRRSEIGPRALGHRSILADPRNERSKDLLNKYKQRQWWRPVAPIVLEEKVGEWFDEPFASPYMLNNFIVKEEKRGQVPAIMHLDATARIQTVSEKDSDLYKLVTLFEKHTGVPIICNTSLNDRGEPIIEKCEEAIHFALKKGINIIYINNCRIKLKNHNDYKVEKPYPRDDSCFVYYLDEKEKLMEFHNPYKLSEDELKYILGHPDLRASDLKDADESKNLKHFAKIAARYIKVNID